MNTPSVKILSIVVICFLLRSFTVIALPKKVLAINNAVESLAEIDADSVRPSVAVENDYVKVLRNSTLQNESGFGTKVLVALTSMTVDSRRGSVHLDRGGVAVFLEGESYQPSEGEYFEVNFKKDHPPLTRPEQ